MYKVILFRTDGRFENHVAGLCEALAVYEETEKIPDEKRVCMVLCGPDTWLQTYK